jgi:chromosome segregation protein
MPARFDPFSSRPASSQANQSPANPAPATQVEDTQSPDRNAPEHRAAAERDESDMRRALGLGAAGAPRPAQARLSQNSRSMDSNLSDRPKRRFVTDGEVPVVVVHGRRDLGQRLAPAAPSPVNRLDAAQSALAREAEARETAERSLAEAQSALREAQTKLGHAALERAELAEAARQAAQALAAERELRIAAEAALAEARSARDAAEQRLHEARARERPPQLRAERTPRARTPAPAAGEEPEPVQWWLTPAKRTG